MTIGIYSVTNKTTGKRYIGMSLQIESRFRYHRWSLVRGNHHNKKLQRAWNKYGSDDFTFDLLEIFDDADTEQLVTREKHFIRLHDTFKNGYNSSLGGDGQVGFVVDPDRLKRMSEVMKGNKYGLGHRRSDDFKKRMSEVCKVAKDTDEAREVARANLKRLWMDKTFREKMLLLHKGNQYTKGKRMSVANRMNLSELQTGENNTFYGKRHSQSSKAVMSSKSKSRWNDEKYRSLVRGKMDVIMSSDDYKQKMSESMRGDGNGRAMLTTELVISMRIRYLRGEKLRFIAKDYPELTKSGISKACRGESWKHLPNTLVELESMLINYQS